MNYWFVQYNPNDFDGLLYLRENARRPNWWLIHKNNLPGNAKEIKTGDTVFIWKAKGVEKVRGIYGIAQVILLPGKDIYEPYWEKYVKVKGKIPEWRKMPTTDVQNVKLFCRPEDEPLLASRLRQILPKTGNVVKVLDNRRLRWKTMQLIKQEGEAIKAELSRHRGLVSSPWL